LPAINLEFYGDFTGSRRFSVKLLILREPQPMPELFLLRTVLQTLAAVLGGFGVFILILSWSAPALSGLALVLIGAASGITYFVER
jgi:hypothetical protein